MTQATELSANGLRALQAGNVNEAFSLLSAAVEQGDNRPEILRAAALAARSAGRPETSLAAADRLLTHSPDDLLAKIIKADALAAMGEQRKAAEHYIAAVNSAPPQEQLSGPLAAEVNRARQECAAAAERYEEFLRSKVRALGLFDGSGHARGEQALDILFGRKQIYYQQPDKFYFPELPQIQFYDPSEFSWTEALVAQTDIIQSELAAVLSGESAFEPYVPATPDKPRINQNVLTGNADWGAFHLFKDGSRIEENVSRCPATLNALALAPQPNMRGKSPIALFSRLKPGTHIPPHTGLMNTRIICHLPLIIPDGCHLRVGNQKRQWRNGEMLIFDDSIEHEARNAGASERIILLFDIWRPELSEDERAFVSAVFDAIEDYGVFA
ncbi:MAG: aspartyl/asparaginyl beta-hydroxylase domain-containing protein [Pseudomonadota bacterium]